MNRKTRLAILWHMHQPFYRNPQSGSFDLPWLRLHALKDYCGMVHILEEFPSLHLTFNLVPSLLAGLELYNAGVTDVFQEIFRKPAAELSPDERNFLYSGTIRPRISFSTAVTVALSFSENSCPLAIKALTRGSLFL